MRNNVQFSEVFADKSSVKDKLKASFTAFSDARKSAQKRFAFLWKKSEDSFLFKCVLLLSFTSVSILVGGSVVLVSQIAKSNHSTKVSSHDVSDESEYEVSGHETAKESDQESAPTIGVRNIPRSIKNRQDGIPESDKDLVQVEVQDGRGLAVIDNKEKKVTIYNPYFTYREVLGSTAEDLIYVGKVAIDLSFEVGSFEVMAELEEREKEMKVMIGSLIAEFPYQDLRVEKGQTHLKQRIFKEVNYILKSGKIKDVLYSNFVMK